MPDIKKRPLKAVLSLEFRVSNIEYFLILDIEPLCYSLSLD